MEANENSLAKTVTPAQNSFFKKKNVAILLQFHNARIFKHNNKTLLVFINYFIV